MMLYRKLREPYHFAAVVLLNTFVLLLLLNVVFLLVFWIKDTFLEESPPLLTQYGQSLETVYPDLNKKEIEDLLRETWSRSVAYEPFTQYKERPYAGKYVNVHKGGFRITKDQGPWPPDRNKYFTVFLFGGSTTFSFGLSDDQTIASYFQPLLATAGVQREARVYNFGRGAYHSTQELILFERLILSDFIPDMAIFIDGLNEFFNTEDQPMFTVRLERLFDGKIGEDCGWLQILKDLPMTRAALWTRGVVESISFKNKRNEAENGISPEENESYNREKAIKNIRDRYLKNKKMIEVLAGAYGVNVIFVWQPIPHYGYDLRYHLFGLEPLDGDADFKLGYEHMSAYRASTRLGRNFLWCADIQEGIKEPLYVDNVGHYSAKMSRKVARCIFDMIIERNLLAIDK